MERTTEPAERGHEQLAIHRSMIWWAILSVAFVLYLVVLSIYFARIRMLWNDEFLAWELISDPSWSHMVGALKDGVDGGGPLFYILGRFVVALIGLHPSALRFFYGTLCFSAAGLLWIGILRRYFSLTIAVFCVAFVWLGTTSVLFHLAEIRFYGQLLLGVTCSLAGMLWIEETKPTLPVCFLAIFGTNSLLVTSHMLGVVYSGLLMAVLLLSRLPMRHRLVMALGALAAWCWLLLFLGVIRADSTALSWIPIPHLSDLARYFVHTLFFLTLAPRMSVLVNLCLLVFAGVSSLVYLVRFRGDTPIARGRRFLVILSLPLALVPVVLFVASHVYKPLFAERYLMPGLIGRMTLTGCGIWIVLGYVKNVSPWLRAGLVAIAVCALVALHFATIREAKQSFDPFSDLTPLLQMTGEGPVILEDTPLIEQVRMYGGTNGARFFFLLPDSAATAHDVAAAAMRQGYKPGMKLETDFLSQHPRFLFIDTPFAQEVHLDVFVMQDSRLEVSPAGSVQIRGVPAPVYQMQVRNRVASQVERTR